MNGKKTSRKLHRTQNPFDDGAEERLRRMNLMCADGTINESALMVLGDIYAGLLFDDLCDVYQDYSCVQDDLRKFFTAVSEVDVRQKFLLICLKYDRLNQPLPDPIWWISGSLKLVGIFSDAYIEHLRQIYDAKEIQEL